MMICKILGNDKIIEINSNFTLKNDKLFIKVCELHDMTLIKV